MKRPFRDRPCLSFTLVELLVVMGIIAILASVLLLAGTDAIRAALRTKAANMENQIQVACLAYYTDYGTYPLATNSSAPTGQPTYSTGDQTDWEYLIWALCGNINAYSPSTVPSPLNVPNTRAIAYLQLNKSSIDSNGIPINPISPYSTNTYFNIAIDGAYSGILTNVPVFSPGSMTWASSTTMSGGVYLWVNCNPPSGASNVNFWVHCP